LIEQVSHHHVDDNPDHGGVRQHNSPTFVCHLLFLLFLLFLLLLLFLLFLLFLLYKPVIFYSIVLLSSQRSHHLSKYTSP
jgi:hypothetical protein